jgi:pseudouridine synthase
MDGSVTQGLLHPKRAVEREYCAWVEGLPEETLFHRLQEGVETSLGLARAKVLSIEGNCVRLVVTEGRNRIVRRMLHNAGFSVLDLMRVRFGPIILGDLDEGMMRPLEPEEEQDLDGFLLNQSRKRVSKDKQINKTKSNQEKQ